MATRATGAEAMARHGEDQEWIHDSTMEENERRFGPRPAGKAPAIGDGELHAFYRMTAGGNVAVRFDFSAQAKGLMWHISARWQAETREWIYDPAFDALVREELAQLPARMPNWCGAWPAPISDSDAKQVNANWRYEHFPRTPDEARTLLALREQHASENR